MTISSSEFPDAGVKATCASPLADAASRVPQVTIFFWVIKCLSTAMGETLADVFVNDVFGGAPQGQGDALALFLCLLAGFLCLQFWLKRYLPPVYWACIILISIAGTLITDILSDQANVPHKATIPLFGSLVVIGFIVWYYLERTLSIHSIYTARREVLYWNVVLWSFALGTAVGDAVAEDAMLGYWRTLLITLGVIGAAGIFDLVTNKCLPPRTWYSIFSFWTIYVATRPLGASLGDWLTGDRYATFSGTCWDSYVDSMDPAGASTSNATCADDGLDDCVVGDDCPIGDYSPCVTGQVTCVTPLACDNCWGYGGVVETNAAFACCVVVLVAYLTFSKYDLEKKPVVAAAASPQSNSHQQVDPAPTEQRGLQLGNLSQNVSPLSNNAKEQDSVVHVGQASTHITSV